MRGAYPKEIKEFETSTKFKRPECTRLPLENFNLKNFTGGACARNSLEKCVLRNPDVYVEVNFLCQLIFVFPLF